MDSQATPYRNSQQEKIERNARRAENVKNLIGEIKEMLIQKELGLERNLTSQELVLFQVVFVLRGIDLSAQFCERVIRTPSDSKNTEQEHLDIKRRREQYRRDKQEAAFGKLEEHLLVNGMGNANGLKLTRVQILQKIRDIVFTLPTINLPPLLPNFLSCASSLQATPLNYGIAQILASGTPPKPLSSITVIPGYGDSTQGSPGSSSGSPASSTESSTSGSPVSMYTGVPMFANVMEFLMSQNFAYNVMMNNVATPTVDLNEKAKEVEEDEEIDIMGF